MRVKKVITWCLGMNNTMVQAKLWMFYTSWNICHFNCTNLKLSACDLQYEGKEISFNAI